MIIVIDAGSVSPDLARVISAGALPRTPAVKGKKPGYLPKLAGHVQGF